MLIQVCDCLRMHTLRSSPCWKLSSNVIDFQNMPLIFLSFRTYGPVTWKGATLPMCVEIIDMYFWYRVHCGIDAIIAHIFVKLESQGEGHSSIATVSLSPTYLRAPLVV